MINYKNLNTNEVISEKEYLEMIERESVELGVSVEELIESEDQFVPVYED